MKIKKILIVNQLYYPDGGGSEIFTKMLSEDLNKSYEVFVLTINSSSSSIKKEKIDGINVIRIPTRNLYWVGDKHTHTSFEKIKWHLNQVFSNKQFEVIKKEIDMLEPDIIIAQQIDGIGTNLYKLANQYRIIQTLHDSNILNPTKTKFVNYFLSPVNKKRSKKIKEVTGVSSFINDTYRESGFFPNAKFSIIENEIIATCLTDKKTKSRNKRLKVGFVGQLVSQKGIKVFLEAINMCENIIDSVTVIGKDTEGLAKKMDNKINYLGALPIPEVYKEMSNFDVLVVPSIYSEPFGRVVIEAYRQRTIVITSNNGALPEINIDKDLILESVEPLSIVDKINRVYSNEYSLERYEKYSYKFSSNIEKFIKVIESEG